MPWPFLFLSSSVDRVTVFPCDLRELRYALRDTTEKMYLDSWPGHGHGPEWRMRATGKRSDFGVMVLDLSKEGSPPLSVSELKALGAWSLKADKPDESEITHQMVSCINYAAHGVDGDLNASLRVGSDGSAYCFACGFKGSVPV